MCLRKYLNKIAKVSKDEERTSIPRPFYTVMSENETVQTNLKRDKRIGILKK